MRRVRVERLVEPLGSVAEAVDRQEQLVVERLKQREREPDGDRGATIAPASGQRPLAGGGDEPRRSGRGWGWANSARADRERVAPAAEVAGLAVVDRRDVDRGDAPAAGDQARRWRLSAS